MADLHTYFVGRYGVWVHNASKKGHCEKIFALYQRYRSKAPPGETPFETLTRLQDKLIARADAAGIKARKIPSEIWGRSAADVTQEMLDSYATYGVNKFPSYTDWKFTFFKGLRQGGVDVHHGVESYISDLLGVPKTHGSFPGISNIHDTAPGIVLPRNLAELNKLNEGFEAAHHLKAIHKGMANGGISGILQSRIPVGTLMTRQRIADVLMEVYTDPLNP